MKSRILSLLAGATLALAAAAPAHAGLISFTAMLNGAAETTPNTSTAFGSATVTFDDIASSIRVILSFSGLTAPATAAHIHCCALPGANAGVALGLTGFPLAAAGAYDNTFTSGFSVGHTFATLLANAEAGRTYLNVHNSNFPGGEIRGQLVPEPGSLALLIGGLGLLALRLRRRQAVPD